MSSVTSDSNEISNAPQEVINEFWKSLIAKKPGKVNTVFPPSLYANLLPPPRNPGVAKGQNAAESYEAAAKECRARVERIIRECQRTNEKFTDPDFDITDQPMNCLEGLLRWDGEWTWTVVDDNLFLSEPDFDERGDTYDPTGVKEIRYKKSHQTGSEALYFASCAHENETWLPLLEKAYAKVHGDYDAISGGISGEAVEDLTGGVTSKILTDRILSKERLWKELTDVNKDFLFSASSPGSYGDDSDARRGLALSHSYSVIKAVEEESEDKKTKHRLVLIRNPWGKRANAAMGEWTGPWSDGSAEWDPYWMKKLGHRFGDDGLFWMSYGDLLKRFDLLDRTRLFDHNWTVVQQWTSVAVGWVTGFMNTKFSVEIKKKGPTVFQLCQLDGRYFRGLEGKYDFDLHFILQKKDTEDGDYIVRARGAWFGNRSISAEVDLEPGLYEVVPKLVAKRDAESPDVHEVVMKVAERNPQKLRQIGLNFDIANAKGVMELSEKDKKRKETMRKEAADKKRKEKEVAEKEEKADFEAWKKEEKAEYEAWKREKRRLEKRRKPEADDAEFTESKSASPETKCSSISVAEDKVTKPAADSANSSVMEATTDAKLGAQESKPANAAAEANLFSKATEIKVDDAAAPSDDDEAEHTSDERSDNHSRASSRAVSRGRRACPYTYHNAPRIYNGDEPQQEAGLRALSRVDDKPKPWNAVCVLGLRVYSQDPEVSIKLVKPRTVEEGAVLDVGGETAAGATM
ncbi:hypothetical protein E8E12_003376 [Didymella heteroderae]|uniref:Calpain catalytic domain-containing protein n=1 Tax=Didymella heteroderae TaxID=1769908 RepID=A0A9P4WUC7_9PLEO|nr:hypothetical protein E8E12_003376 [Didymella heteroderae]